MKNEFIDQMINNIQLTWKLTCMLEIYRTCNTIVWFSKYEFNNKLLGGVKLLRVTSGVLEPNPLSKGFGSSYTWCNSKQCYITQYFLIGCEYW